MKSEEKSTNKEKQTLIIRKYHQYLKLEKHSHPIQWMLTKQTYRSCCTFWKERVSLSLTLPWMTCSILPPDCTTSASIPARRHASCRASSHSSISSSWPTTWRETPANCWRDPNRIQASRSTDSGRDRPHHLRH